MEKDINMSLYWYGKAADGGNLDAMANFGILVNNNNLKSNFSTAIKYLRTCIEKGSSLCIVSLSSFIKRFKGDEFIKKVSKKLKFLEKVQNGLQRHLKITQQCCNQHAHFR